MVEIIRRVKGLEWEFKDYALKIVSEINRGISTICVLSVINQKSKDGVHGYQISKELEEQTKEMLVIEEGTLYPLLRKLERDNLIKSERESDGRKRKFYFITEYGQRVFNYLSGFFSMLTEAIAPLFDVKVNLKQDKYLYCPMCANKIDLSNSELRFCTICGFNIEQELVTRGLKNE